ncbi:hypothetical protein ACN38_g1926 [Penicillium nordicum]|uniref:Small secreted protein n=1 Tax=Penicillium nordicum TaxID=229535 RepID=A0A0M8PFG5_9EURO|nr:hypothetical protein ACN38_g1926 [Penicillium nordicum]
MVLFRAGQKGRLSSALHSSHVVLFILTNILQNQILQINHSTIIMQLTQLILTTGLLASSAFAAPADTSSKSMMADSPQWTLQDTKRVCNTKDTSCTWTFGIYPGGGDATPCTYVVEGSPASRANGGPVTCGGFTVTSGWSGQFGEESGFTTLSVVDNASRQIVWPAYTDKQLASGKVVKPDQSYAPAALP